MAFYQGFAVADYKLTIFYNWGRSGWTETFYRNGGTRDESMSAAKSYVTQRRKSLTKYCSIQAIRVTNVDSKRDGTVYGYAGATGQGTYTSNVDTTQGAENTEAAANMRLMTADGSGWRSLLVRGLPQDAIASFTDRVVSDIWVAEWDRAFKAMKAGSFRLRMREYADEKNLVSFLKNNNRITQFSFSAALVPVPVGAFNFQIRGPERGVGLLGEYRMKRDLTGGVYDIYPRVIKTGLTAVPAGTTGRAFSYIYSSTFDDYAVVGPTSRNTGRPSFQPHGKHSVQRN